MYLGKLVLLSPFSKENCRKRHQHESGKEKLDIYETIFKKGSIQKLSML